MVVFGLSVRLSWYTMWMRVLFMLHVCMLRECEGDDNAGVEDG